MTLSVCVAGATGWTGRPVAEAVLVAEDLELPSAVSRTAAGRDLGEAWGGEPNGGPGVRPYRRCPRRGRCARRLHLPPGGARPHAGGDRAGRLRGHRLLGAEFRGLRRHRRSRPRRRCRRARGRQLHPHRRDGPGRGPAGRAPSPEPGDHRRTARGGAVADRHVLWRPGRRGRGRGHHRRGRRGASGLAPPGQPARCSSLPPSCCAARASAAEPVPSPRSPNSTR